jgi:predicted Fe-Mo cluster-binding NifX family protein
VFDSSNRVLIIDDDSALNAIERAFRAEGPLERAVFLRDLGVGTLVCGAISREYEWALLESGIDLLSFIAGSVDDVIAAWTRGSLERSAFPCLVVPVREGVGAVAGVDRYDLVGKERCTMIIAISSSGSSLSRPLMLDSEGLSVLWSMILIQVRS